MALEKTKYDGLYYRLDKMVEKYLLQEFKKWKRYN